MTPLVLFVLLLVFFLVLLVFFLILFALLHFTAVRNPNLSTAGLSQRQACLDSYNAASGSRGTPA